MNLSALRSTSEQLKTKHPRLEIETIQLNVCDENAVNAAVEKTVSRFGRLDLALNVAGIAGATEMTAEAKEESWKNVLDVNLNGVWRCQRAELKAMIKQE